MGDTLPEVAVTGLPPVDLYNGTSADITPWAETVQIDIFENAKAASGETLRTVNLSYEEYARMRQDNPHLGFPELEKPANPNSGATQGKGAAPPAAVSLTPNVLQARVYSMPMAPPPRHQPQGFKENAQHVGGIVVGAAQAMGNGALAAASYASDSLWQLGDLATGGYFRDTELMQGVWQRQGARGEGIVGAVTSPVETVTGIVDDLQARQQQAEALRAAGDFYEAGKVAGTVLADISPVGGAVGVLRKLPDGTPVPAARHGADGVVITAKPRGGAWEFAPNWDKWRENGGTVKPHPDGSVTYTRSDGVSVTYNKDGFPDFSPFAKESVSLDNMRFDHYHDFKAANEKLGIGGSKPPGAPDFTWHHHQDGKTMQLVPTSIHNAAKGGFPHAGGISSSRN